MNQFEDSTHGRAEASGSGVAQAKEQVQEVAQRAQHAAGNAQVKVRDQIDQRSTRVGEQVAASALALRAGADELVRQGNQSAADAAQRTAAQAERFGSSCRKPTRIASWRMSRTSLGEARWRWSSAVSSSARLRRVSSRRRVRVATRQPTSGRPSGTRHE